MKDQRTQHKPEETRRGTVLSYKTQHKPEETRRRTVRSYKRTEELPKETISREAEKEKIAELKRKKRQMQEELDELSGNTIRGKVLSAAVFLGVLAVVLGVLAGMVKLNVGGVAETVFAPVIGDVPVLRSILPGGMQRKSASELAAEQAAAEQKAQAAADAKKAEAEEAAAQAQAQAQADAKKAAEEEAAAQAQAQAQAEEEAEAAAEQQAEQEAALQDYVTTYSNMKPKDAAKVFDSMLPEQSDLIVKILENLKPDQRADILSNMSVANAAELTVKMEQ